MEEAGQKTEIEQAREQVAEIMKQIHEYDAGIDERNQKRLYVIEQLRDLLPQEQFERFEEIITKTVEASKPAPDASDLPHIVLDEENPLETLRQIRCKVAQDVCDIMGVDAPTI